VKFLKENPNHIVIFSSDMSHEDQVEQGSQTVIDKEADTISDILNGILLPSPRNNYPTMCGPENLALFISVSNSMGEYPVIRCYDDSLGKKMFWTTNRSERVVSYLSMVSYKSKQDSLIDNKRWILTFYKSFILSSIYSSLSQSTLVNPEFPKQLTTSMNNGLFITIMDRTTRATRACIGEFFKKGISMDQHILEIIPRLIIDARDRWENPFRSSDKGKLICEFTILDNTARKIPSTLQNPNISFSSKINGADNAFMIKSGSNSGTFIPDVWKSHPDWSPKQYIMELLGKANGSISRLYTLYARKTVVI
jgi:AMMECR1 domain-containing protein